ncbi:uncharacterized protein CTRU02_208331 [Colletotrichum truncatum]|uniref:Uncharacterized protein n=1 Tax=Colletotrichum truncatum TaxID=5467 RepID=A0ACC3YW53_COLTU|nr:uncharacterized protein CTRU02_07486 [Colletotrichum truncatum]KAF6791145.1 hypothetical protein CTRU02_07486 [Colletotrichum truncatum]
MAILFSLSLRVSPLPSTPASPPGETSMQAQCEGPSPTGQEAPLLTRKEDDTGEAATSGSGGMGLSNGGAARWIRLA